MNQSLDCRLAWDERKGGIVGLLHEEAASESLDVPADGSAAVVDDTSCRK